MLSLNSKRYLIPSCLSIFLIISVRVYKRSAAITNTNPDRGTTLGETNNRPHTFKNTMARVQTSRTRHLKNTCASHARDRLANLRKSFGVSKNGYDSERETEDRIKYRHIVVNHRYKFVFCLIPKVASTHWKLILWELEHGIGLGMIKMDFDEPSTTNGTEPGTETGDRPPLTRLSQYGKGERERLLRDYTRIIFVRHPLERIISTYWSKFIQHKRSYSINYPLIYGVAIIKKYRFKPHPKSLHSGYYVHLEEFLRYVTDSSHNRATKSNGLFGETSQTEIVDPHWDSYKHLCAVCDVGYNFIGKFETLQDDYKFLIVLLKKGESSEEKLKSHGPSSLLDTWPTTFSMSRNVSLKLLTHVPPTTIARFNAAYASDYSLFNYSVT